MRLSISFAGGCGGGKGGCGGGKGAPPNGPSTIPNHPSGPGRGNNPPKK